MCENWVRRHFQSLAEIPYKRREVCGTQAVALSRIEQPGEKIAVTNLGAIDSECVKHIESAEYSIKLAELVTFEHQSRKRLLIIFSRSCHAYASYFENNYLWLPPPIDFSVMRGDGQVYVSSCSST